MFAGPGTGLRAAPAVPKDKDYLAAMKAAANYAFVNRQVLTYSYPSQL